MRPVDDCGVHRSNECFHWVAVFVLLNKSCCLSIARAGWPDDAVWGDGGGDGTAPGMS